MIIWTLQANVSIPQRRDEVFVVPWCTGLTGLRDTLAGSRAGIPPHELIAERCVAEACACIRASWGSESILSTALTPTFCFVKPNRTTLTNQDVCVRIRVVEAIITKAGGRARLPDQTICRAVRGASFADSICIVLILSTQHAGAVYHDVWGFTHTVEVSLRGDLVTATCKTACGIEVIVVIVARRTLLISYKGFGVPFGTRSTMAIVILLKACKTHTLGMICVSGPVLEVTKEFEDLPPCTSVTGGAG